MGEQKKLENIVNSHKDHYFIGMKTLAAGKQQLEWLLSRKQKSQRKLL
jgi:hypothetical protein